MNGLLLSVLLHGGHTLMSFWQNKTLSLHNLISSWFTLIVCMGYITVQTGIYQAVHGTVCKFPYEPYVLEFLFYLIFMWPFRNFRSRSIVIDSVPFLNGRLRSILKVLLFSYSFYFLLMVKVAIYVFGQGVGEAYDATHFEGTTLYQYSNFESKILWICGSLYDWTSPIIIIYALYGIISKRNGWTFKFNSFCILYILGIYFLNCISTGQRGGIFFFSVRLLFVFVPFWTQIPKKAKRYIVLFAPYVVLLFLTYAISMTLYRVDDSTTETPLTSVLRYLGEPYPHLGNAFWNKVFFYPMGTRLYPFIFEPATIISNANSLGDQHAVWEILTGVPILNYKTLYGDFYVDFGPYIPFAIIFIYSLILKFFTMKGKVTFASYPILYYYITMASMAPLWFNMRDWIGLEKLIAAIVAFFILKRIK